MHRYHRALIIHGTLSLARGALIRAHARARVRESVIPPPPDSVAAKGCAPAVPNCAARCTHGLHYLLISLLNISTARASRHDVIKINAARRPRPGVTRLLFIIINNSRIAQCAFILSFTSYNDIVKAREDGGKNNFAIQEGKIIEGLKSGTRDMFPKNDYSPSYEKLLKSYLFVFYILILLQESKC